MNTTIFKKFKHFTWSILALIPTGLFLALSLFTILTSPGHAGFALLCLIIAFVCGAVGRRLYLSQNGLDLDPDKRVLLKWRRSGGKREEEAIELESLELVKLSSKSVTHTHRETPSYPQQGELRSTTSIVYPVSLVDKFGSDQPIITCGSYLEARNHGEKIAKIARLSLQDTTTSPAIIRTYDRLDENLGKQLLREGAEIDMADPPPGSGLKLQREEDKTLISLPGVGLIGMAGAMVLLFLGVPLAILVVGLSGGNSTAFLVTAGPVILISGAIIWNASVPRTIAIDGESISVKQREGLRFALGRIRLSELEEVIVDAGRLICRGDCKELVIHLKNHDSAAWVKKALEKEALDREIQKSSSLDE